MQTQPSALRTPWALALSLVLIPLVFAVLVIALPISLAYSFYQFASLRFRAWRAGERYYLVVSPRHGWRECLTKNLVPNLPPGVVPVWVEGRAGDAGMDRYSPIRSRCNGMSKPCLVEIKPLRTLVRSVNTELLPLKALSPKDPEAPSLARKIFDEVLSA